MGALHALAALSRVGMELLGGCSHVGKVELQPLTEGLESDGLPHKGAAAHQGPTGRRG